MRRFISLSGLFVLVILFMGQGCLRVGGSSNENSPAGPAGVYLSTDKTETWVKADIIPTAEGVRSINTMAVYKLVPDPHDPNTIYLATRSNGLLYTHNGGRTWQQSPNGQLSTGFIYDVVVHPKDTCTVYVTDATRVFKTTDCSRTWQEVYRELRPSVQIVSLDISGEAPYKILLAGTNGDLLVSDDVGATWNVLSRFKNSELAKVAFDPYRAGVVYVVSRNNGLFRSEDNGENWTALKSSLGKYSKALEFRRFQFHPTEERVLYWVSTYGILVSTDAGDSWSPVNLITQPGSVNIYAFEVNPKNTNEMYYTATIATSNRSTLYKSVDGGQNWTTKRLPTAQIPVAMYINPNNEWLYLGFTILPQN